MKFDKKQIVGEMEPNWNYSLISRHRPVSINSDMFDRESINNRCEQNCAQSTNQPNQLSSHNRSLHRHTLAMLFVLLGKSPTFFFIFKFGTD